ncbi:DUF2247 family protein [Paludibacterium sp. THUN1379]|uniref:DUF2247 family protein n=1 Tax=Paludibacterium sp. THUN1379 TaxID=3112107 RepID=UPI00308585F4|nr:DUF2247 family protein [Paludibacterium sp. THUN1379]
MCLSITIPLHFAEQKTRLSWAALLCGYQRALLTWRDLVEAAKIQQHTGDPVILSLAKVDKNHVWQVSELATQLAQRETRQESEIKKQWLFLSLAWVYENRLTDPDPLGTVETIYADFDYPQEMASFVRYMPVTGGYLPNNHSPAQNHQRMMDNWQRFLTHAQSEWMHTTSGKAL